MAKKIWSDEELQFLKENYMNMSDLEIAEILENKTSKQVKDKREHEKLGRVFKYNNGF